MTAQPRYRIDNIDELGDREASELIEWWYDNPLAVAKHRARYCVCRLADQYDTVCTRVVVDLRSGEDVFTAELHPSRVRKIRERRLKQRLLQGLFSVVQ